MVCQTPPDDLPFQIEVQPLESVDGCLRLGGIHCYRCDREALPELKKMLGRSSPLIVKNEAQILIRTLMPCGALAECGVCTVESHRGQLLACKDGPVFDLKDLLD